MLDARRAVWEHEVNIAEGVDDERGNGIGIVLASLTKIPNMKERALSTPF